MAFGPSSGAQHSRRAVKIDTDPSAAIVHRLRAFGVDSLDLVIASHNHTDHIGGASEVLRQLGRSPVGMVHRLGFALLRGVEAGAAGGILAVACFAAALAVSIGEAFGTAEKAKAGSAQEILAPLSPEIVERLGIPGIKAAMDLVGSLGGLVRAPLSNLGERERSPVADLLGTAGLLGAARSRRGVASGAG